MAAASLLEEGDTDGQAIAVHESTAAACNGTYEVWSADCAGSCTDCQDRSCTAAAATASACHHCSCSSHDIQPAPSFGKLSTTPAVALGLGLAPALMPDTPLSPTSTVVTLPSVLKLPAREVEELCSVQAGYGRGLPAGSDSRPCLAARLMPMSRLHVDR